MSTLSQLVEENSGNCELRLKVQDKSKNIKLGLLSRKYRVEPSPELFEKIESIPALKVGIA